MLWHSSSVSLSSTMFKNLSSETSLSVKARLYVEHPRKRGAKVCVNGIGHLTKMALMAINRKKRPTTETPIGFKEDD